MDQIVPVVRRSGLRAALGYGIVELGEESARARELAAAAKQTGLSEKRILPAMEEWEVVPKIAAATALQAIREGGAREPHSREELLESAAASIQRSRAMESTLYREGLIAAPPAE